MATVLIVDDCDDFRDTVGDVLAEAGHVVLSANGPEEARTLSRTRKFQLIICDLVMPVEAHDDGSSAMVGVHMVSEFNRLAPNIPIIAISGELVGGALQGIQQFGAVLTLSKPFGQDELLGAVDKALTNSNTQQLVE